MSLWDRFRLVLTGLGTQSKTRHGSPGQGQMRRPGGGSRLSCRPVIFKRALKQMGAISRCMISCSADKSGQVLAVSYSQHVGVEDMRACLGTVRDLIDHLKPGFLLLSDLTNLESMDAACAPDLGAVMDLCRAKGMSTAVRVIPDPGKDIGFDLISRFHLYPEVKTRTHENLAEAIKSLLGKPLEAAPADLGLS